MIEEYETAIEELKSANEEMVSVNEELQSTNEELETSKEELQSVNEELHTVNQELTARSRSSRRQCRSAQPVREHGDRDIFLDRELVIRSFTPAVTASSISSPTAGGRSPISSVTSTTTSFGRIRHRAGARRAIERPVRTRDGAAHYLMRILPYRSDRALQRGVLVTFVDLSEPDQA